MAKQIDQWFMDHIFVMQNLKRKQQTIVYVRIFYTIEIKEEI